jgi:hypothetical protein
MTDGVDISALTPEQAAAKLVEMTRNFRGPPSDNPQAQLNRLYADPEKRQKLEAGDGATRREFDQLVQAAAKIDPIEAAMSGFLPDVPTSEMRLMSEAASWLRDIGIREDVVRETLSNQSTTQEIHDAAVNWKKEKMTNPEFVKAYLNGGLEERRLMTLCAIVLTQPITKGKAA